MVQEAFFWGIGLASGSVSECNMPLYRFLFQAALLGLLVLVPPGPSAEKKDDPKPQDKQVVDSKAAKRTPATTINFKKELQLPFPSLGTLGSRIESARRQLDPVALGNTASELGLAEKVADKQASLTSTALYKEAVELAKLRKQVAEMKAMLHLSNQIANAQGEAATLKSQIDSAQAYAQAEKRQIEMNEEPTGPRRLIVNNYSTQYVDITVNGNLKGQVLPGESRWFMIEHKWNPTILKAYGNEDTSDWGPMIINGTFKTYTWNLH